MLGLHTAGPGTLAESLKVWKEAVADEESLKKYAQTLESRANEKWDSHRVCLY